MTMLDREHATLMSTYKRLPLEIARGEGMYLVSRDGRRYLDMFAGLAVNALGNAHPRVTRAIADQAAAYTHLSNYFLQEPQIRLAELLTGASGFPRVFFANSGAEANEGALKIARRWGAVHGRQGIVAFSNGFHGRTLGTLSLMDRPKYRDGFGPFLEQCSVLPFNDSAALTRAVNASTTAILVESIQGEGGIRPLSQPFAETLRTLQQRHGILLIADEVQAGVGRTGTFFGFQHFGLAPDLVTLAKPIGGGLPLGAILGGEKVIDVLEPGMHGTTFGGNPVACAAGAVVIDEVVRGGLMENAAAMGSYFLEQLRDVAADFPSIVREVRGYGLMVGVELHHEGETASAAMRERGILINCTDHTVLRFLPPLIVGREHIDETVTALREVFRTVG
jgi:predicted acetylornithine/succinylornithine family transaminase